MDVKSLLFHLLAVVALGQAQKQCCFPDQFEILSGEISGSVQSGQGVAQTAAVQVAFDYTNRRFGELVTVSGDMYQQVNDYNKGAEYVINLTTKTCQKLPLPTKQMMHCVPSNATYIGPFYSGDHKLSADSFGYFVNEEGVVGNATLSVTQGDCIPFSQSFTGSSGGESAVIVTGYVNYTPGIQNPSKYFNIPSYCPTFFSPKPRKAFGHVRSMMFLL